MPIHTRTIRSVTFWLTSIGVKPDDSPELRAQKTTLVLSALLVLFATTVWGLILIAYREPLAGCFSLFYTLSTTYLLARFSSNRNYRFFLYSQVTLGMILPALQTFVLGGLASSGAIILWSVSSPIGVLVLSEPRRAIPWWLTYLGLVVAGGLWPHFLRAGNNLPASLVSTFTVMNIVGISSLVILALIYFVNQKNEAYRLLHIEERKSENLLLNILPREIAARLKNDPTTIAEHFEQASILFADLVDFTPLTESLPPVEMVSLLNQIFSHFDDLVERHELHKIRNIGDNYMVVSGVPRQRPDHAQAAARLALEMVAYIKSLPPVQGRRLAFRVGINSGPVVAGVIGRKKFVYDIWGDAVNLASRMESHSLPDQIQITRTTYELIRAEFECQPRGRVAVKGKGETETWLLVGVKEA